MDWGMIGNLALVAILFLFLLSLLLEEMGTMPHYRSKAYKQEFARNRRYVLQRDGYRCQRCGATGTMHVHHRIARSRGGGNGTANLVTLCPACHGRMHGRRF